MNAPGAFKILYHFSSAAFFDIVCTICAARDAGVPSEDIIYFFITS
jgi:hypothetical protein